MALKYRKAPRRPWPVVLNFPVCDPATGEVAEVEQRFVADFDSFDEAKLRAIRREVFGDEADPANKKRLDELPVADAAPLEAQFFARLLLGWAHVSIDDSGDVPYSEVVLRELCTGDDGAIFRRGFNRAISELRFGIAPAKNSQTSPAPGPTPAAGEAAPTS